MHQKQQCKQGLRNNAITRIYAYKHIPVPVECFSIDWHSDIVQVANFHDYIEAVYWDLNVCNHIWH